MKQCPQCAATAPQDMRFCSVCGSPLREATTTTAPAPAPAASTASAHARSVPRNPAPRPTAATTPPPAATLPTYMPSPSYAQSAQWSPSTARPRAVGTGVPGTNGLAIAALVVSLLAAGWLAVPFGHIARYQCRKRPQRGNGLALAALALGYLSLPINLLFLAYLIIPGN